VAYGVGEIKAKLSAAEIELISRLSLAGMHCF
jgi:hypothetical protein